MCKQGFAVIAMETVVSECVALSSSSPNQHPGLLEVSSLPLLLHAQFGGINFFYFFFSIEPITFSRFLNKS